MKKKTKTTPLVISKKTILAEILENYPHLGEILIEKYGLYCVGCHMAAFETIEEGAKAHGIGDKDIEKMVKNLNDLKDK